MKNLLKKYKISPSKKLGQNFLTDKRVLKKFIKAVDPKPKDIILEIGPGIGNLTIELAKRAKKVIAVEKDPNMVEILKETLKDLDNVEVVQEDILKIQFLANNDYNAKHFKVLPSEARHGSYKMVGNIPFYLTAPVIRKFLESENPPKEIILIVQKEVAQRICAKPPCLRRDGGRKTKMNLLAVSVQVYATPKIEFYISKKSFWPCPKVDSAIIKISNINRHKSAKIGMNQRLFFKIVRAGFSHPRKQLINNLSQKLNKEKEKIKEWLLKNNIQPTQRAETLSIEDWKNLTKTLPFDC